MTQSFKKVVGLLLAVVMVFSMCTVAFAEEATEKEITALDLGVTDGNNLTLYDDPTGTGEKVLKAQSVKARPNVELADPATKTAFDPVAGTVYTVKFDAYLESSTNGHVSFDLYYGAFSKYDPNVKGSGKKMISATTSGYSDAFFGDGKWHTITKTFTAEDVFNTYKEVESVPVYEEDGVTQKIGEDGNPVFEDKEVEKKRDLPYLYLTWYNGDFDSQTSYIKNIEIIEETGATGAYGNNTIPMSNVLDKNGALVGSSSGMTSKYNEGGNTVVLNEDGTVTFNMVNMGKTGNVGETGWYNCVVPLNYKAKSDNRTVLYAGRTYTVTVKFKSAGSHSGAGISIATAKNTISAGSSETTIKAKRVLNGGNTDGWETLTATFAVTTNTLLKIGLTGGKDAAENPAQITIGDINLAYVDNTFANAKLYTMNDNGQPFGVAAYVGTDITYVGANTDSVAAGEKFMGWYEDAQCVNATAKFGEVTTLYAKYPTTIIDFNHMSQPKHPYGFNQSQGASQAYDKGIWRITTNANIGAMIPAYDAAGVPQDVFYAFKQGVRYEVTFYYQAQKAIKETYTEEVTVSVPKTDENGDVIFKTDENGDLIQKVDADGNPVFEDGEPVWEMEMVEEVQTVTKEKEVWTTEGTGVKMNLTLAKSAAVSGERYTNYEQISKREAFPDSAVYTSDVTPANFTAHTISFTANLNDVANGICFRFMQATSVQFRMDKIVIKEISDETFADGGLKGHVTLNYNDGVTADETIEYVAGQAQMLPTPTREGYIFAGWYENYRIGNNRPETSDIPVSFIVGVGSEYGKTYTALWVAEGTTKVDFSEDKYSNLGGGDKGGKFSIVTDETVDTESIDNTYAKLEEPGNGNSYKVSFFNEDGSRMYAVEGITYRFTIRYKVANDRGTSGLSIGVGRSLVGSYGPIGLNGVGNMSEVVKSKNTDGFVTETAEFTVAGLYETYDGITEGGVDRIRQQLCLRINSGTVYVDYVEVTPLSYTPEYANYIDNADVELNIEDKTFTIIPDEGYEVKVGTVKAVTRYVDYTIIPAYTDEAGKAHKEACDAADKTVVKMKALAAAGNGNTYKFSLDDFDAEKIQSLAITAEVVKAGTVNANLIGVSTRAESGKGETYKSAGIRFRGRVSAATVENATEIGFVVVPKAALTTTVADYMAAGGGVERVGVAYNAANGTNIVYKDINDYVDYQAIVYLTTESGAYDFTETELTVALYVTDAEGNTTYVAEYTDSYANRAK